jgi:hypothetical protein
MRIVERERWSHRGFQSETIHRRLCTMMSSTHRDAGLIEDLASSIALARLLEFFVPRAGIFGTRWCYAMLRSC